MPEPLTDAPDEWIIINAIGGYVCSACGIPVESEPCPNHQPSAYTRMDEHLAGV